MRETLGSISRRASLPWPITRYGTTAVLSFQFLVSNLPPTQFIPAVDKTTGGAFVYLVQLCSSSATSAAMHCVVSSSAAY